MECERSVITMTLLRLDYLVHGLGNCADDTRLVLPLALSPPLTFMWATQYEEGRKRYHKRVKSVVKASIMFHPRIT